MFNANDTQMNEHKRKIWCTTRICSLLLGKASENKWNEVPIFVCDSLNFNNTPKSINQQVTHIFLCILWLSYTSSSRAITFIPCLHTSISSPLSLLMCRSTASIWRTTTAKSILLKFIIIITNLYRAVRVLSLATAIRNAKRKEG